MNVSSVDVDDDDSMPISSSVGSACLGFISNRSIDVTFGPDIDIKRANEIWNCHYPETPLSSPQKVTFSQELVEIHPFDDDDESRDARIGTWASDGQRFLTKIQDISNVLSPILCPRHRQTVYEKLYPSANTS